MSGPQPIGLDPFGEAVYRTMLLHPELDTQGIADRLEAPEPEVRAALDHLADLALTRPTGAEDRWRAVNPELGLATLLARQEAEAARRQQEIERSRAAMAGLIAEYASVHAPANQSGIELISSLGDVRDRLVQLASDAAVEVLSLAPGGPQPPQVMEASRALDLETLERGVRMRTVYQDSVRNDPATVQYARWLHGLGGAVRTLPTLPLRMILVDNATAIVPIDPEDPRKGAVLLHSPGVIAALRALFEQLWDQARPLGEPVQRGPHGLTAQERELLRLLAEGLTDERAGQRLGVSLRTIRRMMADLMVRMDARSRFQAGIQVAALGWLGETTPR
ncbi:LuxR C-terminal-related transcriptional regulator [Kitasatospora sp. NBC_00240]|uniref:LuxR C-terminal-related transcriptional regulator n=1 Tax=Kitasatospora sp. NBC_00240 TaxID=2903567 RepID=UPI00224CBF9B|nr:LuxR C-terminal-related transcriptional regulator [Kitasatospora sp. NBC_00240]MCX5209983.1 LuxR C-terminal-related transcriptional regulator [Kitasatospora sp. NBC_00240]